MNTLSLSLSQWFRVASPKHKEPTEPDYSVRYAYPGYAAKVRQTHEASGGVCCCCMRAYSQEAHHVEYLGELDQAGGNLLSVCFPCHRRYCHSKKYWIIDPIDPVWGNRNTPEFADMLRKNLQILRSLCPEQRRELLPEPGKPLLKQSLRA